MDLELLSRTLSEIGEPRYRNRQVWAWLARGADSYEAMSDLSAALRAHLAEHVPLSTLTVEREERARDGTVKALLRTAERHAVESVLMRYLDGRRSLASRRSPAARLRARSVPPDGCASRAI